jgi:hypothetical protein
VGPCFGLAVGDDGKGVVDGGGKCAREMRKLSFVSQNVWTEVSFSINLVLSILRGCRLRLRRNKTLKTHMPINTITVEKYHTTQTTTATKTMLCGNR